MFLSKTFAFGEEKTQEAPLQKDMLSWTESEIDFGQNNYVSFQPGQDVVKVNAEDDWDALVLYMRKEDILRSQNVASGTGETKTSEAASGGVLARTFVYGNDQKGEAKWRKVPLQIVSDAVGPTFARSFTGRFGGASKETRQLEKIPSELKFGENGQNDPVRALLQSDVEEANRHMTTLRSKTADSTATRSDEEKLDSKLNPEKGQIERTASSTSELSLTRTQTLKALTYLNKAAERSRSRKASDSNSKVSPRDPPGSPPLKLSSPPILEEGPSQSSIEQVLDKHRRTKLAFEDDEQTALLDHACGLRRFCSTNHQQQILQVDDQEILFDQYDDGEGNPPLVSIEVHDNEQEELVLTSPTMATTKRKKGEQNLDKMRHVMFKLLKNRKQKKKTPTASSGDTNEIVAPVAQEDKLETLAEANIKKEASWVANFDDDDNPLGQASSSSLVEARLSEMGYKKISEVAEVEKATETAHEAPKEVEEVVDFTVQDDNKISSKMSKGDEEPQQPAKPERAEDSERPLKVAASAGPSGRFALGFSPGAKKAVSHFQKAIQARREKSMQNLAKNFSKSQSEAASIRKTTKTKVNSSIMAHVLSPNAVKGSVSFANQSSRSLKVEEQKPDATQKASENMECNQPSENPIPTQAMTKPAKKQVVFENADGSPTLNIQLQESTSEYSCTSTVSSSASASESCTGSETKQSRSSKQKGIPSSQAKNVQIIPSTGENEVKQEQVSGDDSYAGVAAVEVDYYNNKRGRRGRFNKKQGFENITPSRDLDDAVTSFETESSRPAESLSSLTYSHSTLVVVAKDAPTSKPIPDILPKSGANWKALTVDTDMNGQRNGGRSQRKSCVNPLKTPLSFDEQKVQDRIARDPGYQTSEPSHERVKGWRANRKGLSAILGISSKSSEACIEPTSLLEKVVVEVGNETSDRTVLEEFNVVSPLIDDANPRRKKSLVVGKLKEKLNKSTRSLKAASFMARRPVGINTSCTFPKCAAEIPANRSYASDNSDLDMSNVKARGGFSSMPYSPNSEFSRPWSPTSATTHQTPVLDSRGSVLSAQTDVSVDHVSQSPPEGFGGPCNLFNMSEDGDENEYDDEIYTLASGSQGDNDIIEVAQLRIAADEALEKARDAARLMSPVTIRPTAALPSASGLEPPAIEANAFMPPQDHFDPSTIIPPPPPPGSPRRRRLSPRKNPLPSQMASAAAPKPMKSILKTTSHVPPPPPPPPPSQPRRSRGRSQQKIAKRKTTFNLDIPAIMSSGSGWNKIRSKLFLNNHSTDNGEDGFEDQVFPEIYAHDTFASNHDDGREVIMMEGTYVI